MHVNKHTKILLFVFSFLLSNIVPVHAQEADSIYEDDEEYVEEEPQDSVCFSILTCAPGSELYSMFGHTAIRMHFINTGRPYDDFIFNYGAFDYNAENFYYHFVKGETDYLLAVDDKKLFLARYFVDDIGVREQILDLTYEERYELVSLLLNNTNPKNCAFRYNWMYDNCTTRARNIVFKAIKGKLIYKSSDKNITARQMLEQYTKASSWTRFGINLIMGYELDENLSKEEQMFLPDYLANELDSIYVQREDGSVRPLVASQERTDGKYDVQEDSINYPLIVFGAILVILIAYSILFEMKKARYTRWLDAAIYFVVGIVGILISFLFFCSLHAGVSTNMLVLIFNPLVLIFVPLQLMKKTYLVSVIYAACILAYFLAVFCFKQHVCLEILILVFILLERTIVNILLHTKIRK